MSISQRINFDPDKIFYSAEKGVYFIDAGKFFRPYSRVKPIKSGIKRFLEASDLPEKDHKPLINSKMEEIEIDRAIDWHGKIAGCLHGITEASGRKILVTEGYNLPESETGPCLFYLLRDIGIRILAVIDSGGKSLHFWTQYTKANEAILKALTAGHAPLRLPGAIHEKTGKAAKLFYLNPQY